MEDEYPFDKYLNSEEAFLCGYIFDKKFRDYWYNTCDINKIIRQELKYIENREHRLKWERNYRQTERGRVVMRKSGNKYRTNRLKNDKIFKLAQNIRNRINKALKNNYKSDKSRTLLGCSIEFLKLWLELQFEDGMSWDNWGIGVNKWQIDHIRPCYGFDLSLPKHQQACFHYTNLRPLWMKENLDRNKDYYDWKKLF